MILAVGEILFDHFPEGKRLGGAPFNFAAHLKALGLPVTFVSRVGMDDDGDEIMDALAQQGFDPATIQRDPELETGRVTVALDDDGVPEFTIVPDVAYDRLAYTDAVAAALAQGPGMIYFGTLIQRSEAAAATVMKILENRPKSTRCICDLNLREDCYDQNSITKSLVHCDILKISEGELSTLQALFNVRTSDKLFIDDLMHNFAIAWVSLTSGVEGSTLFTRDEVFVADPEESHTVVDTVGAGDGYAAILAAGNLLGWPPAQILRRATRFAGALCRQPGAIPEDPDFYRPFLGWMNDGGES
jgi:fructokinase